MGIGLFKFCNLVDLLGGNTANRLCVDRWLDSDVCEPE